MEEAKSNYMKRKVLSEAATRSGRLRLNGNGVYKSSFAENRSTGGHFKDLRVHRIFSHVLTEDLDVADDCTVAEKVFGSDVVGSLGQDGVCEHFECVQATPPEEVLAKSKIVCVSKNAYVSPDMVSGRQRRSPGSKSPKPRSRIKLFGNPSSFSYRRLLPYLMDITKGALKSLEMKPQLPTTAKNSVVEISLQAPESKVIDGTDLSPICQVLSPSKASELLICTENTADTIIPVNARSTDQAMSLSSSTCDLSYGHTRVPVNKNNELSQSDDGQVEEVLYGMDACGKSEDASCTISSEAMNDSISVDSATLHSPDENRGDLMNILEDALLCKDMGLGAVKPNEIKYDEPLSNIFDKNSSDVDQETHLDDKVSSRENALGIERKALKPVSPNKRNLDHDQLVSEVDGSFSVETMSCSSSVESPTQLSSGENRSEQTNVLGNALSYKHLHLSDTIDAKENVVNFDKPQSTFCSQGNAELVHITPVVIEDIGRKDATNSVKSVSKLENNLDNSVINSTDSKQSPSERKLHLKPLRLKRFKNYNSVSYRKLLPYLTEIYEDTAGSSNKGQVKMEPAIVSDAIKKGHSTSVSGTALSRDSSPISAASWEVEQPMGNVERVSDQDTIADPPIESHLDHGLKSLNDLQIFSHVQGQPTQGPQTSCDQNDKYLEHRLEKSQCTASNFMEEDLEGIKKHSDDSNLSDVVPVYPELIHKIPFASPSRGILKKNPKGCRGLCTCLKCSSFRLHAEKAFEFSRSQLFDSQEIALELINELSVLRNLLKKSVDADSREASQLQVREACNKSHAIEQHAKARFKQLNHDLQIHCQIPNLQRPSVSFARHTEEKIIQTAHSQASKSP